MQRCSTILTAFALYLVLGGLVLGGAPAWAADAVWQPLAAIDARDRSLAEAVLAPMFGNDPHLWPEWLDPRAVLIPLVRGSGDLLVIRQPVHGPCGQFIFSVFGPASAQGARDKLGEGFCAGDLDVIPATGRPLPDLLFSEGHIQDAGSGLWRRQDQRVRWSGTDWVLVGGK